MKTWWNFHRNSLVQQSNKLPICSIIRYYRLLRYYCCCYTTMKYYYWLHSWQRFSTSSLCGCYWTYVVTGHLFLWFLKVNNLMLTPQVELVAFGGVDAPQFLIHPLPKQQNLPQRPTSLHLLPKTKETTLASSRLKLGKLKSNQRQVQQGLIWSS